MAFRGAGLGLTRDGSFAERIAVPAGGARRRARRRHRRAAAGVGIAGVTALDIIELGGRRGGHDRARARRLAAASARYTRAAGARARRPVIAQTSREESVAGLLELADHVVVSHGDDLETRCGTSAPRRRRRVRPARRPVRRAGREAPRAAAAPGRVRRQRRPVVQHLVRRLLPQAARILGYGGLARTPAELSAKAAHVLELLAAGALQPVATTELPLDDVNEAHARIVERRAGGKLLLIP